MLIANRIIGTCAYMGGVPAVLEEFCWAYAELRTCNAELLCAPGEAVHYDRAKISFHAHARNSLVRRMEGDWLLLLDTDHAFEPDLALRMVDRLHRYQIDVLVALHVYKTHPFAPCIHLEKDGRLEPIIGWTQGPALFPCDSAGAGALLVRRTVFERIAEELKQGPFDIEPPYSEDHSFFRRLARLDPPVKAWFDPRLENPHLSVVPRTLADFDPSIIQEGGVTQKEGIR